MTFNSLEEVAYVRQHMDSYIIDGLADAGFTIFGMAGGGFAYMLSTEPVKTVEDLKSQKIWIPDDNPFTQEMVKAFGITPVPLALADVRTGLQTGLINTVATSPSAAIILQWHTQIKYLVDVPFLYLYATFALSNNALSKISPHDRTILKTVMEEIFREIETQNNKDNIDALNTLKDRGIIFISPDSKELSRWRQRSMESSDMIVKNGLLPEEAVETLNRLLQAFRSQKTSSNDN
jgi:TRAP-type C4-dicarboxylate transport system substrate-binding protein